MTTHYSFGSAGTARNHTNHHTAATERHTMTDPAELLDQLDAAREAATPGPWDATSDRADGGAYIDAAARGADSFHVLGIGHAMKASDAALIVAAVNHVSGLVAIVRDFWSEHDGRTCHDRTADSHNGVALCPTRDFIGRELGCQE